LALTRLNLRHVREHESEVPSYFRRKISLEMYRRSIAYTREKSRLAVLATCTEAFVFWVLLLSGGFGEIDRWLRSLHLGATLTGIGFFAIVGGIFYLVSLPFALYSTFVIEQKYGFNKMTWSLWFVDLLKGLALIIVLGAPVLATTLWFMDRFVDRPWWLYVWLFLAAVQLFITTVFPVFIVPLFNKLTPLGEGRLKDQILGLAEKVRFKTSGVFMMDGSKRSGHANAFFAGMGRFRRIVLFDTLVKTLEEPELLAVVAHEMGHNIKKHVRTGLLLSLGSSLAGLFVLSLLSKHAWFYQDFGFEGRSSYAALFIFTRVAGPYTFFLTPLMSMFSRKHEYEADRFAAETMEASQPMIQGLVKLSQENLSNLTPHPLYSFFFYSHPTVLERVRALEQVISAGLLPDRDVSPT